MSEEKFLENYKKKIIKNCIKSIYKNHNVIDKNNNIVSDEALLEMLLTFKIIKRCIGCTNTVPISQCSRNAIDNFDYCKTHLSKIALKSETKSETQNIQFLKQHMERDCQDFKKIFIQDSFYYIDTKFIYNKCDFEYIKVGYINTLLSCASARQGTEEEYILTSDPFILEMII